jgi:aminopeptidase N
METPFDMWLNEAFTVDVDRQFMMSRFDPVCMRLEQVDAMRAPVSGPLAIEDGGHLGQIVRDGFNDPDELVDGVTYVKAAEVIRMLRLILGAEVFRRSKNLYFQRYGGGNANTDQFFACFEEVSGRNLSAFKREWLYTIGYPAVTARWRYEEATRTLHIKLRQARSGAGGLFHFPVELAAVDEGGRDIPGTARVVEMGDPRSAVPGGAPSADLSLDLPNVPRPSFVSFNRSGSFYGTFLDAEATPDSLARQIRLDPNRYNRVEAMRRLTDTERIRLIEAPGADVSGAWVQVFADITRDASLEPGLKAYLLRIDEESLDRRYTVRYPERYRARIRLLKTVAEACRDDLLHAFETVDTYRAAARPTDGVEERRLKAVVLRTLTEADTPEVHRLAEAHWRRAWNITDRLAALQCINLSGCPNRPERLEEAYWEWKDHLSAYAGYLQVVGSGTREDVFDRIEVESRRPTFRIEHPTHSRALFAPMATNNKVLWTERGLRWMADTVIRLAPINDNAALRLVNAFQQVRDMGPTLKPGVIRSLQAMKEGVAPSAAPSVAGRIAAYLTGAD